MVESHRRRDRIDLEVRERAPVAHQHVGVADRRLDVLGQRLALRRRQFRRDVRDHHVEAGEHGVARLDAMQRAIADIGDLCLVAVSADMDAGRIETDADRLIAAVERAIVERRRHDVVHGVARRDAGNERADQEARDRRVAVGEMIDVGLLPRRVGAARELQAGEARIAEIARLGGRHRVAAEPEEAERAALEAVRHLLAAAADFGQIVAIAGAFQELALFASPTCRPADRARRRRARRSAPCSPPKSETPTRTRTAAWRWAARCLHRFRGRRSPARRGRTPRG